MLSRRLLLLVERYSTAICAILYRQLGSKSSERPLRAPILEDVVNVVSIRQQVATSKPEAEHR